MNKKAYLIMFDVGDDYEDPPIDNVGVVFEKERAEALVKELLEWREEFFLWSTERSILLKRMPPPFGANSSILKYSLENPNFKCYFEEIDIL